MAVKINLAGIRATKCSSGVTAWLTSLGNQVAMSAGVSATVTTVSRPRAGQVCKVSRRTPGALAIEARRGTMRRALLSVGGRLRAGKSAI